MNIRPGSFLVFLVFAFLSACGGSGEDAPDANLKVYRHAMDEAPTNLDPAQSATVYSNHVTINAYDTLFRYKYLARPYQITTNAAAAMPVVSEDGKTYTFKLKPGILYMDDPAFENGKGRQLVAADFVYSIKRHFDPKNLAQGAWLWSGKIIGLDQWGKDGADYDQQVEGLKALDDLTIQIKLNKPYPQLLHTFAQGFSAIVPREAVEEYGRELSIHPVGSGPFIVKSFDPSRAVFVRNPNYRKEAIDIYAEGFDEAIHGEFGVESIHGKFPPLVDRLELNFIGETAARWNSFTKAGEVQFTVVPSEQVDAILEQKKPEIVLKQEFAEKYNFQSIVESGLVRLDFNMSDPEIGYNDDPKRQEMNKALRCALRGAFNWDDRNSRFYSDIGVVFPGVIVPVTPEFDENLSRDSVTYDPLAAQAQLFGAGWTEETLPVLDYATTSSVKSRQFYEQVRGWWSKVGYPTDKVVLDAYATFGDFNRVVKQGKPKVIPMGWGLDYPDAQNTLQLYYGPFHSPGSNSSNYANPEYDKLYEQSAVMQESDERTAIYRKMNEMIIDDCVTISGISRQRIFLWHKNVIAYPDRQIVGGFFFKFVDLAE